MPKWGGNLKATGSRDLYSNVIIIIIVIINENRLIHQSKWSYGKQKEKQYKEKVTVHTR